MTNTPMLLPLLRRGAAVKPLRALALIAICGVVITACSRDDGDTSPLASLSVSVSPSEGEVGSPLDMTYTWVVAPNAPSLAGDVWVFVHFLDADGERMWTDDHQPPTPANEWKPGSTIRYTRTTFVPRYQYLGQANIAVGLYSRDSGERFQLSGAEDMGLRSYRQIPAGPNGDGRRKWGRSRFAIRSATCCCSSTPTNRYSFLNPGAPRCTSGRWSSIPSR